MKSQKVFTLPNILCMARIAFTPIIGYLVIDSQFTFALTLCAIGSVTDLLDGYIARKYDCVTRLGAILDPMADKLLVATLTICLTAVHLIPLPLTALILSRDLLIIFGALFLMNKRLRPPKTLSRLMSHNVTHVCPGLNCDQIDRKNGIELLDKSLLNVKNNCQLF